MPAAAPAPHPRDTWTIVLGIFALGNLVNAAWMLVDPVHWYENLPAGVPDFGPLNEHFVRDIGCTFALLGVALGWAAFVPRWRVAACGAVAFFYVLHAIVHVADTVRGLVGPEHWAIDLPGVYVPAVLLSIGRRAPRCAGMTIAWSATTMPRHARSKPWSGLLTAHGLG